MNVLSQINVLKIVQNEEKWVVSVGEDQNVRSARLDTGRSLEQTLTWCQFVLVFLADRKVKNTFDGN